MTWSTPRTFVTGETETAAIFNTHLRDQLIYIKTEIDFIPMTIIPQGRLTLESGVPISTSDQTAKTSVYYTPYLGNLIRIYDASDMVWKSYSFSEVSVSVPSNTNTPFDVFAYISGGSVALEVVSWTNDTTRATALTTQDGVYVKSGDASRLYLGTGRTTGTSGECEDSVARRFLWNYYHRVPRQMLAVDNTNSWTYNVATFRAANNNTTDGVGRVAYIVGVDDVLIEAHNLTTYMQNTVTTFAAGIGLDSTSADSATISPDLYPLFNNYRVNFSNYYKGYAGLGYHYLQRLEKGSGTGTHTWYGDNGTSTYISGMFVTLEG